MQTRVDFAYNKSKGKNLRKRGEIIAPFTYNIFYLVGLHTNTIQAITLKSFRLVIEAKYFIILYGILM